jgi:hypothetical protein
LYGLRQFAEAADTSLTKFKNLIYLPTSDNALQLERTILLYSQMHCKLFESTSQNEELQNFFFKRIVMYAITRVFPTVTNRKAMDGVCSQNVKLLRLYFE